MPFLCFWSSVYPFFWSLRFGNLLLVMSMFMFNLLPSFPWLSCCSYRDCCIFVYQVKQCQTVSVSSSVHSASVFAGAVPGFGFVLNSILWIEWVLENPILLWTGPIIRIFKRWIILILIYILYPHFQLSNKPFPPRRCCTRDLGVSVEENANRVLTYWRWLYAVCP